MTKAAYSRIAVLMLVVALSVTVAAMLYTFGAQYRTISSLSDQVNTVQIEMALMREEMARVAAENKSFKDSDRHIAIALRENKLYLMEGSDPIRVMPVATGTGRKIQVFGQMRDFSTPPGVYNVTKKETDPVWIAPEWHFFEQGETDVQKIRQMPISARSFRGQLGKYRLVLRDGIGIHGTTDQSSIGRNASHGCIRVGAKDLEILFNSVDSGTKVYIY